MGSASTRAAKELNRSFFHMAIPAGEHRSQPRIAGTLGTPRVVWAVGVVVLDATGRKPRRRNRDVEFGRGIRARDPQRPATLDNKPRPLISTGDDIAPRRDLFRAGHRSRRRNWDLCGN